MGYEKYPRGDFGRREQQDDGRSYGSGRDYTYSSAREYAAAGAFDRDRGSSIGAPEWEREQGSYASRDEAQRSDYGRPYGEQRFSSSQRDDGRRGYRSDEQRYNSQGRDRYYNDDQGRGQRLSGSHYGVGSQRRFEGDRGVSHGHDDDDRGFFARAGDEVRSWFGDEDAERRREADLRYDERAYNDRDADYGNWRRSQIAALDRDYDEYRRENRSRFESEFSTWRSGRQTQRDSLTKVEEHMDVVGSDGSHVGTVDKVRGDRILLTKNDADAGGRHHSIPSSWIAAVDTQVTLSKSADEAQKHWRDEERNRAIGDDEHNQHGDRNDRDNQGRMLNRSFSGTY